MHAQGFDIELKQFPGAWRATFYPTGIAHSIIFGTAHEADAGESGSAGSLGGAKRPARRLVSHPN